MNERTDAPQQPPMPSRYADVTWLHRFINCVPFGADAPVEDIARAHSVVERLEGELAGANALGMVRIKELEQTVAAYTLDIRELQNQRDNFEALYLGSGGAPLSESGTSGASKDDLIRAAIACDQLGAVDLGARLRASAELARVRGLLDDYFAAYPHGKLGDAYRELTNAAAERLTRGPAPGGKDE